MSLRIVDGTTGEQLLAMLPPDDSILPRGCGFVNPHFQRVRLDLAYARKHIRESIVPLQTQEYSTLFSLVRKYGGFVAGGYAAYMMQTHVGFPVTCKYGDIDIYIPNLTERVLRSFMKEVYCIMDNEMWRTECSINFTVSNVTCQVPLLYFADIEGLLRGFDIPAAACAWIPAADGIHGEILCTPDCLWQCIYQTIVYDDARTSRTYIARLRKYYVRGFDVLIPDRHEPKYTPHEDTLLWKIDPSHGGVDDQSTDYLNGAQPSSLYANIAHIKLTGKAYGQFCGICIGDDINQLFCGHNGSKFMTMVRGRGCMGLCRCDPIKIVSACILTVGARVALPSPLGQNLDTCGYFPIELECLIAEYIVGEMPVRRQVFGIKFDSQPPARHKMTLLAGMEDHRHDHDLILRIDEHLFHAPGEGHDDLVGMKVTSLAAIDNNNVIATIEDGTLLQMRLYARDHPSASNIIANQN